MAKYQVRDYSDIYGRFQFQSFLTKEDIDELYTTVSDGKFGRFWCFVISVFCFVELLTLMIYSSCLCFVFRYPVDEDFPSKLTIVIYYVLVLVGCSTNASAEI